MLMQRLSRQNASRRAMSSCSAAAGDCSLAAWTASLAGRLVTGNSEGSRCHGVKPSSGASAPTTGFSPSMVRVLRAIWLTSSSRNSCGSSVSFPSSPAAERAR
jgi:hypothetical protein